MTTEPTINRVDLQQIAIEACETLRQILEAEGLTLEAATLLPPFERAVRATIAAVESGAPEDFSPDFALAYLTGRIAKEQVRAIEAARAQVRAAADRAANHWNHAIAAERHRLGGRTAEPLSASETLPQAAPVTHILQSAETNALPRATAPQAAPFAKTS
jgi:hypothetical protein